METNISSFNSSPGLDEVVVERRQEMVNGKIKTDRVFIKRRLGLSSMGSVAVKSDPKVLDRLIEDLARVRREIDENI